MLFTISGKHVTVPEAVRQYAQEKTSRLPRYYSGINHIEVVIDSARTEKVSLEVIARGEHHHVFVVTEKGHDVYKCIDAAVQRLEEQLRRKKTKERDDKHKGGGKSR